MRAVGLDFLDTAPSIHVFEQSVHATRDEVWRAFSDATTWKHWWPGVRRASYGTSVPPYGVGTFREAEVSGQRYEERILAWDEGRRLAYRIDRATAPIANAQVECTELEDAAGGTRVRWTIAYEPRLLLILAGPLFRPIVTRVFRKAMANLEAHLRVSRASVSAAAR